MSVYSVTFERGPFVTAFGIAASVLPRKTRHACLAYVQLILKDGHATLVSSDGENGLRYQFAEVDKELSATTLLPSQVAVVLKEARGDYVVLVVDGETITMTCGSSEYRLKTLTTDEYPAVAAFTATEYHTVQGSALCAAIKATVFATEQYSTRYALAGILIDDSVEGELTFVATDGSRMSVHTAIAGTHGTPLRSKNTLIPLGVAKLIARSVSGDSECRLATTDDAISIQSGGLMIAAMRMQGLFPTYREVLPVDWDTSVSLPVKQTIAAVKQAIKAMSKEQTGLTFAFANGEMVLRTDAVAVSSPVSIEGPAVSTELNPKKVLEYLQSLGKAQTTELWLTDNKSPVVFCEVGHSLHVLMPFAV